MEGQYFSRILVVDPDLQIRGGGGGHPDPDPEIGEGGGIKETFFSALRASFWSKNKEGSLSWIRHCI